LARALQVGSDDGMVQQRQTVLQRGRIAILLVAANDEEFSFIAAVWA